jgi:hypothetical protein
MLKIAVLDRGAELSTPQIVPVQMRSLNYEPSKKSRHERLAPTSGGGTRSRVGSIRRRGTTGEAAACAADATSGRSTGEPARSGRRCRRRGNPEPRGHNPATGNQWQRCCLCSGCYFWPEHRRGAVAAAAGGGWGGGAGEERARGAMRSFGCWG